MGDGQAIAKYHDDHARYGGASREFHERAASFCRGAAEQEKDLRAKLAAAEAERDALRRTVAALNGEVSFANTHAAELAAKLAEAMKVVEAVARHGGVVGGSVRANIAECAFCPATWTEGVEAQHFDPCLVLAARTLVTP